MRQRVSKDTYRRLTTIMQKLNMLSCILCGAGNTAGMKEIEDIEYQLRVVQAKWISADSELMQESIDRKKRYKGDITSLDLD